ncbi:Crp/Fnr family transcriptional regulator [Lactococcus garvieae]|uniref:Crp/Fnr family transcriptional regulator n=1 Tax=Lactococcus garvieae TaxID=1363 RepID=UPI00288E9492|nr:Crp/Fnr family transcriptional regulator [Lactococcus garvieae]MDT2741556.1 Crp/Fnr family transcriptional regulator [Lactococcus garvieae]
MNKSEPLERQLINHHCVKLVPLFASLSSSDLAQVEEVVHHKVFKKGEVVIDPMSQDPKLVIVAKGEIKMYQLSSTGKEQLLRVVEPGGYEGEKEIFGVVNDNLFGEALSDSTICFLNKSEFTALLLTHPQLSLSLLKINAEKERKIEYQTRFLMMEDVSRRLVNYLMDLSKSYKSNLIKIPMKSKDLATFIGTTPETISRKMKLLESKGLIVREGKKIKILDYERLEDEYS